MCGIYGYLGHRNGVKIAIDGLKRLEYRGYDSAGLAGIVAGTVAGGIENKIECFKEVGKIPVLEHAVGHFSSPLVIAHTRWATHGKLTRDNAHPHLDDTGSCAVVHNGIIENHQVLRERLKQEGARFLSET